MAAALEVAKRFLWLSAQESEPDYLSHLRLQKLLYYAQGWSLVNRNVALFGDRIEAWAHGPVVPSVFPVFADYKFQNIAPDHFLCNEDEIDAGDLTDDEGTFVEAVWGAYRKYSATSLREMTHREPPWVNARGSCGPADRCSAEITQQAMKDYFSTIRG